MGDFDGHPFRGNQYSMPGAETDVAPGRTHYYHATPIANLKSIAEKGLQRPEGSQNPISLAPHLESAQNGLG